MLERPLLAGRGKRTWVPQTTRDPRTPHRGHSASPGVRSRVWDEDACPTRQGRQLRSRVGKAAWPVWGLFRKFLVLAVGFAFCLPAGAWGPEGHRIIGELAAKLLTPAARSRVAVILEPGNTLASVSNWADDVRQERPETAPWHYIDIPIRKPSLNMARDCPKRDCVIAKIEDFQQILQDSSGTTQSQREALMFLTHFIEDLHQPLHCSDNKDRGGNDVAVEFLGVPTNLHSLWDSGLVARMGPEDQLLQSLSRELTRSAVARLSGGSVRDWAEESHRIAQSIVYGRLPSARSASKESAIRLGEAYERAADPVIRLQLERAAARLAKTLNTLLPK